MKTSAIQAALAAENWPPSIIGQVVEILDGGEPSTLDDVWGEVFAYELARRPSAAQAEASMQAAVSAMRAKEAARRVEAERES